MSDKMSHEECKKHLINFIESRTNIESFSLSVNMKDVTRDQNDGCKHYLPGNIFTIEIKEQED